MNKIVLTLVSFLLFCIPIRAQISLSEAVHDFGQIIWYNQVPISVTVTNKGHSAITLSDVRTSCSCITAQWPHSDIAPGASVEVQLTFNANMLGHFVKTVSFYADGIDKPEVMYLKGFVIAEERSEKGIEGYPYHVGNVYLDTDNLEFDEVERGESPQDILSVYNAGSNIYQPELMHLPKYLSAEAVPKKLLPGRSGKIIVTLDSKQLSELGLTQTNVYVSRFPGDRVGTNNELSVSAVLIPTFDTLSVVQKNLAPALEINTTSLDLPSFGKKKKVKGKVYLKNIGKSTLEIRALQVFNPALNVSLGCRKIPPGREEKLDITVQSAFLNRSRSRLRVLMITNDPKNPKVIINVKVKK